MLYKENLHKKVQELVDCFIATDPLQEMSTLAQDEDQEEAALKWLALTALHAVNQGAEKIELAINPQGEVSVVAKYREASLPSPGPAVAQKAIEAMRAITHIEGEKGKTPLALGIGQDGIMVNVKLSQKEAKQKLTLKFPG
ncbi:hypothetical protein AAU61_04120 [Desulfocarbo indianensis]|nr:hypothetical protein AAU61_04120 [Desulfocarbo indianensis]